MRRALGVAADDAGARAGCQQIGLRAGEAADSQTDVAIAGKWIESDIGAKLLSQLTPVGQRISLRLTLPYEGTVTVQAETVYGRPGFGFAVRFVDVSDETYACLRSSLDKLRQNVA